MFTSDFEFKNALSPTRNTLKVTTKRIIPRKISEVLNALLFNIFILYQDSNYFSMKTKVEKLRFSAFQTLKKKYKKYSKTINNQNKKTTFR
jgi:hypothetical protein